MGLLDRMNIASGRAGNPSAPASIAPPAASARIASPAAPAKIASPAAPARIASPAPDPAPPATYQASAPVPAPTPAQATLPASASTSKAASAPKSAPAPEASQLVQTPAYTGPDRRHRDAQPDEQHAPAAEQAPSPAPTLLQLKLAQGSASGPVAGMALNSLGDSKHHASEADDALHDLEQKVHREVVDRLNRRQGQGEAGTDELVDNVVASMCAELSRPERKRIARDILNEIRGLGPLEELLADESISEIMVNGPFQVYVERHGKLELTGVHFHDEEHLLNTIDRIISPLGRHVDESNPMVDGRLADGSRVNVIIPPLALCGPTLTIRRFSATPLQMNDLIDFGSLSFRMAQFLEASVKGKLNIMVSGGTGSGKTTLLNVLSGYIPTDERIVTIEDAAELRLMQNHVVTLEARPANLEGKGEIAIRDLVRNALRMRPDRIVVGECRGGEALDMLQAMNTGHEGSLTTAHANSPRDLLGRLETMVLMAGMNLPIGAIRQQISSAIDLIVQQSRLRDGSRKIVSISEVLGMEGDTIVMQEIYHFQHERRRGSDKQGVFIANGIRPTVCDKLADNDVNVSDEWFA